MSRKLLGWHERLLAALLGPFVFLALAAAWPEAQPPLWWTTSALVKVRPDDPPPAATHNAAEISAARNEFEPFQIVLRPGASELTGGDVEASDLRGPHGAVIRQENLRIYFEPYLELKHVGSASAEWPDPLIPRTDQYAGERRNAFPFTVETGRNQPIWIEVYVPPETPPGDYSGQIRVTANRIAPLAVPVYLHVRNFALPSTSSLPTSFGFSGLIALRQHRGKYTGDEPLRALTRLYAKAALWHRVSIHGGTFLPPPFSDARKTQLDWSEYDKEVGPFLDGTIFSKDEPLYGAKATSIDLRANNETDTNEKQVAYWKAWAQHFGERGWLGRLFYYVWDEPHAGDLDKIIERARLAHQADPRLRVLLTTSYSDSLSESVDIWTPLINCVESRPGFAEFCDRAASRDAYNPALRNGKSLWWYQSCASHGCQQQGGAYFHGWPSYLINDSGVANRVMPWISWKYRIGGELYYNMDESEDPWKDIYRFGGNGDGTLFYPGRPDRIGGHTDIPIESIRLKLIREGLEDYEYLVLLKAQERGELADQMVARLVRAAYDFDEDPQTLYAVRKAIGDALEGIGRRDDLANSRAGVQRAADP